MENVTSDASIKGNPLSDKQKRKLEWERKLKEQKQHDDNTQTKNTKAALSKGELRAQRRLQQESQRQAKSADKHVRFSETKSVISTATAEVVEQVKVVPEHSHIRKASLVSHLYADSSVLAMRDCNVHPAFTRLGAQYAAKAVIGSNARALALLSAIKQLIVDFECAKNEHFCRALESKLTDCTEFVHKCRPFAVSMSNALRQFKLYLTQSGANRSKRNLIDFLDGYVSDEIFKAGEAISNKVNDKISANGDTILTFGWSSLVKKILLDAHRLGKTFDVIVVDAGRPLFEGREMLRVLSGAGIRCTYVHINAVNVFMGRVTKVLLGAHSLLANGYVMARMGTAMVALAARNLNKTVLVCCETYKFCERVQTDSFVFNEIGDLGVQHQLANLCTPLALMYDVTPPEFVTAVVTELAILPCTSVPVVLRIKPSE